MTRSINRETGEIIDYDQSTPMAASIYNAADWREDFSPFDLENVTAGGTKALSGDLVGQIVGVQRRRVYYASKQAVDGMPPDCASQDGVTGVGEPGGACASCPLSIWGSSLTRAAACKEFRFIYLLREGEELPIVVRIPPTSLKQFRDYYRGLLQHHKHLPDVTTRVTLEATKNSAGTAYNRFKIEEA